MLLHQFLEKLLNAPKWAEINVGSVENYGLSYVVKTEESIDDAAEQIESLKDDIKANEEEIKKLEHDLCDEKNISDKLEKELNELRESFNSYQLSPEETIGDLFERNTLQQAKIAELQDSLNKFHRRYNEDQKEILDLRARKNKATVKRGLTTGRLMANFGGAEYELVKKN